MEIVSSQTWESPPWLTRKDEVLRAASKYKQMKVVVSEVAGGRLSIRAWVKPVNHEWTQRDLMWHKEYRLSDPPRTVDELTVWLAMELLDGLLPESPDSP